MADMTYGQAVELSALWLVDNQIENREDEFRDMAVKSLGVDDVVGSMMYGVISLWFALAKAEDPQDVIDRYIGNGFMAMVGPAADADDAKSKIAMIASLLTITEIRKSSLEKTVKLVRRIIFDRLGLESIMENHVAMAMASWEISVKSISDGNYDDVALATYKAIAAHNKDVCALVRDTFVKTADETIIEGYSAVVTEFDNNIPDFDSGTIDEERYYGLLVSVLNGAYKRAVALGFIPYDIQVDYIKKHDMIAYKHGLVEND